jgi:hypothetical protein
MADEFKIYYKVIEHEQGSESQLFELQDQDWHICSNHTVHKYEPGTVAKRCAADYMFKLIGKDKGSWPKVFVIYEGAYTELIKTELSRHLVHLDYEPMFKSTQIKGE